MSNPVGVILAAGMATRMRRPKQLLRYGDTTVLGAVVATALESNLDRVVVALGAFESEIRAAIDLSAVEVVVNPEPERGNISSLRLAAGLLEAAPALLLMGDMPGVTAAVINAHLAAWRESPHWLVTTTYEDGMGHPFMLSPELLDSVDDLDGRKPLWRLAASTGATTLRVPGTMPVDIDTPADYHEALSRSDHE